MNGLSITKKIETRCDIAREVQMREMEQKSSVLKASETSMQ